MNTRCVLAVLAALAVGGCHSADRAGGPDAGFAADLIVLRAKVWTGDAARPWAGAFAVRDGRFIAVGSDADVRRTAGRNARRLDVRGATIVPGLIDAHLHLISGGLQLSRLQLRDVPDRRAFIDAVAAEARRIPKGQWILGGRWSTESWPEAPQPVRDWIDPVTPDHPVLLSRMDGHAALANAVALMRAGIDRNGPADPVGGKIERDPTSGEPTGILKESAIDLVESRVPPPSSDQQRAALDAAMFEAHRHGLTCVHTMSPWSDVAVLDDAREAGRLTLRVRVFVSESDWRPFIDKARAHKPDDWLRTCGFKQYVDGSLGSRTAYMREPYADNPPDRPAGRGMLREVMHVPNELHALCAQATAAGFSPALHAIGDMANHIVLDTYERLPRIEDSPARLRIEHAQHLLPDDIRRFAPLGVIASMQPLHKADDARYAERALGRARCRTSYAFRALLDAGAHVAFGSDWSVVSLDPFLGIAAAVTGQSLDGRAFVPEQNITVEEALACYTHGAAYAASDEERLGKIRPGFLADFVVLGGDPFSVPAAELSRVGVRRTFVGGREVWSADLARRAPQ